MDCKWKCTPVRYLREHVSSNFLRTGKQCNHQTEKSEIKKELWDKLDSEKWTRFHYRVVLYLALADGEELWFKPSLVFKKFNEWNMLVAGNSENGFGYIFVVEFLTRLLCFVCDYLTYELNQPLCDKQCWLYKNIGIYIFRELRLQISNKFTSENLIKVEFQKRNQ